MRCYRRMTYEDRCHLSALYRLGKSVSEIARTLGFHKSSVSRELMRGKSGNLYQAKSAQLQSEARFRACRRRFKITGRIEFVVNQKIEEHWAPLQISGRLQKERVLNVSTQTIYNYIHRNKSLNPGLEKNLRYFGKRIGRGRTARKNRRENDPRSIHQRLQLIDDRSRLGDWERDTMFIQERKRLLVCADRKSRFTKIIKVKEPYCLHLTNQTNTLLSNTGKLKSLTNDNGSEFFDADQFDVPVYYCDPKSPHQRGTVENTIGLVRQYISLKTKFETLTDQKVQAIENRLNMRPRKCLDYKTPFEVFSGQSVALVS